jgi:ankyrin repeat protein
MSKLDNTLTAVYQKDLKALEKLTPADLNLRDQDGRTPLMHAVLTENADPILVRLLVQHGADVNTADFDQKWTPLHFAARDHKEEIVRILLEAGANVDAIDSFGNTPLWRAVMTASSNLAAIRALIKHGADPYKNNNHGVASIDIARQSGRDDIAALLESEE